MIIYSTTLECMYILFIIFWMCFFWSFWIESLNFRSFFLKLTFSYSIFILFLLNGLRNTSYVVLIKLYFVLKSIYFNKFLFRYFSYFMFKYLTIFIEICTFYSSRLFISIYLLHHASFLLFIDPSITWLSYLFLLIILLNPDIPILCFLNLSIFYEILAIFLLISLNVDPLFRWFIIVVAFYFWGSLQEFTSVFYFI